ncbi:MAG: divalent-cation tolerance protein CutA [Pseudomonadota bacterium]
MSEPAAPDRMVVVYSVYGSPDVAKATASALLDANLIACANIFPAISVLYRWEGNVVDDAAIAVIFKTRVARLDEVRAEIRDMHEDDVPVILTLDVADVNSDYLAWLIAETAG